MLRENSGVTPVFYRIVFVNVNFGHFISHLIGHIDYPVSCHPGVPSIGFSKNIIFGHFCDSVIVELEPSIVKTISNEGIIVP